QLSKTCHSWRSFLHLHMHLRWDFNRAFRSFVPDASIFRAMMGRTGTILTGRFALDFLRNSANQYSLLDICSTSLHANEVLHFFLDRGYQITTFHPT
ncbi:hypothetical protein CALVIDRAFT_465545, partial [Calocera viscosa TUFC12733]